MAQRIYIEPGQDRKVAAIDVTILRVPLFIYENTRRIYVISPRRGKKSRRDR